MSLLLQKIANVQEQARLRELIAQEKEARISTFIEVAQLIDKNLQELHQNFGTVEIETLTLATRAMAFPDEQNPDFIVTSSRAKNDISKAFQGHRISNVRVGHAQQWGSVIFDEDEANGKVECAVLRNRVGEHVSGADEVLRVRFDKKTAQMDIVKDITVSPFRKGFTGQLKLPASIATQQPSSQA